MAGLSEKQQAFVDRYAQYANLVSMQTGLPSRVVLAKIALETGWGGRYANNNLPGLQPGNAGQNQGSTGSRLTGTWEDYGNGSTYQTQAKFLKYPTPEESFGGLVSWLQNSRYMNNLGDRPGGGILQRDAGAEASAVQALGSSGFSTDTNASRIILNDILPKLPENLGDYGIAASFSPAINQLAGSVPYTGNGWVDVSRGLDPLTTNDYYSRVGWDDSDPKSNASDTTLYQTQGVLQPYEKGTGLALPSPTMGPRQDGPGFLDSLANGAGAVGRGFTGLFGGDGAAADGLPTSLPAEGTDGFGSPGYGPGDALGGGNGSFGPTPRGFDGAAYLAANGDVAAAGMNPWEHYTRWGQAENRPLNLSGDRFSGAAYLAANPDVAQAGLDPFQHFQRWGADEGRTLAPSNWSQTQGPPAGTTTLGPGTTVTAGSGGGSTAPTLGTGSTASTIGAPAAGGGLPAFFSPVDYVAANADLAGMSNEEATQHYLNFGQFETRALAPWLEAQVHSAPNGTPTQGPGTVAPTLGPSGTTPTLGPDGSVSVMSTGLTPTQGPPGLTSTQGPDTTATAWDGKFDAGDYLAANRDVQANGMDALTHYLTYGQGEGRVLDLAGHRWDSNAYLAANPDVATAGLDPFQHFKSWGAQEGRLLGPLGGNGGQGIGNGFGFTGLNTSSGTGSGAGTASTGREALISALTFDPTQYFQANPDVAASGQSALDHFRNYGMKEGRALNLSGDHFNGQAYLAANQDVAMAGLDPIAHFMRYGGSEARTLAPTGWTSPLTATTEVTPQGASWLASTYGHGSTTPTFGAPDLTPMQGPPGLTSTYGPPTTSPTFGPGNTVPTIGAGPTQPSWSPGGGISNGFGFTGLNAGTGLGATNQSFGSLWPVGSGGGEAAPAAGGGGEAAPGPFDFSSANVGGFDVNALGGVGGGGPSGVNEEGISGGFDSEGAMRRVLEQQAADLRKADQAAKTPMHSDSNSFNAILGNGGSAVGFGTPLQNPGALGGPVVPNLTTQNLGLGAPGAMFGAFAPWR